MEAVQKTTLTQDDSRYLRQLIKDRSGMCLAPDDTLLLEDRLFSITRENGFTSLSQLVGALRSGRQGLPMQVVTAVLSHKTSFFRDEKSFEFFSLSLFPHLIKENKKKNEPLRIWSMGCATGQEPYSIAIFLKEMGVEERDVELFATDISPVAIDCARRGVYTKEELKEGISEETIKTFFRPFEGDFQLEASVRHFVKFQVFNLLDEFDSFGQWDVIFCRNILKNFDPLTRASILDRVSTVLSKKGILFLGEKETILGISDKYDLVEGVRGAYKHYQDLNLMQNK